MWPVHLQQTAPTRAGVQKTHQHMHIDGKKIVERVCFFRETPRARWNNTYCSARQRMVRWRTITKSIEIHFWSSRRFQPNPLDWNSKFPRIGTETARTLQLAERFAASAPLTGKARYKRTNNFETSKCTQHERVLPDESRMMMSLEGVCSMSGHA